MKKRCILLAAALALIFCLATGCREKNKGESTDPTPDTVVEAAGDPATDTGSDSGPEPAPAPESPSQPDGSSGGKKPGDKYILDAAVDGEDF